MKSRTLTVAVVALAGIASGAVLVKSVSFSGTTNAGYSSTASSATARPGAAGQRRVRVRLREQERQDRLPGVPGAAAAPVLVRRRDAVALRGPARGGTVPVADADPHAHSHSYAHRLGPGRIRPVGVPVIVCVRIGVFVIVIVGHGDQPTGQLTGWRGRGVRPC